MTLSLLFFFLHACSVRKAISKFINDGLTDRSEITDKYFSDERFLSVIPSIK
jgi:hypothetical protein